jgi:hypothetical protein
VPTVVPCAIAGRRDLRATSFGLCAGRLKALFPALVRDEADAFRNDADRRDLAGATKPAYVVDSSAAFGSLFHGGVMSEQSQVKIIENGEPERSQMTKRDTIALAEYAEACEACRAYEKLTRTSLAIFMTFVTGLLAATQSNLFSELAQTTLAGAGFIISVVMLNITLRLRSYYGSYMHTAKAIEKRLGMTLYTVAWNAIQRSWTVSNKWAIGVIFAASALYFLGFVMVQVWDLARAP